MVSGVYCDRFFPSVGNFPFQVDAPHRVLTTSADILGTWFADAPPSIPRRRSRGSSAPPTAFTPPRDAFGLTGAPEVCLRPGNHPQLAPKRNSFVPNIPNTEQQRFMPVDGGFILFEENGYNSLFRLLSGSIPQIYTEWLRFARVSGGLAIIAPEGLNPLCQLVTVSAFGRTCPQPSEQQAHSAAARAGVHGLPSRAAAGRDKRPRRYRRSFLPLH